MKVVAKPIEMVAWFDKDGVPHPVRFKLVKDDETTSVIKIDRVITKEIEKLSGNKMILFNCRSLISGVERFFQIKYELNTCKWVLFKI